MKRLRYCWYPFIPFAFLVLFILFLSLFPVRTEADSVPMAPSSPAPTTLRIAKAKWSAEIVRPTTLSKQIKYLSFSENHIPVVLITTPGNPSQSVIEVRGHYSRPGWSLYFHGESILGKLDDPSEFRVTVHLTSTTNQLTLIAKGASGTIEQERIMILNPISLETIRPNSWGTARISVGIASLFFHQSSYGDFRSTTGVVRIDYATPSWESALGLDFQLLSTVLTLNSQPIQAGPQIIGAKLAATYRLLPESMNSSKIRLTLGASYLTMLSNGAPFGFANLLTPELGISTIFSIKQDLALIAAARFQPLSKSVFGFDQYGVNLSLGGRIPTARNHALDLEASISDVKVNPTQNTLLQARLFDLRLGYRF